MVGQPMLLVFDLVLDISYSQAVIKRWKNPCHEQNWTQLADAAPLSQWEFCHLFSWVRTPMLLLSFGQAGQQLPLQELGRKSNSKWVKRQNWHIWSPLASQSHSPSFTFCHMSCSLFLFLQQNAVREFFCCCAQGEKLLAVDLTSASLSFVNCFGSDGLNLVSSVERGTEHLSGGSRGQIRSRKPEDVIYNFF